MAAPVQTSPTFSSGTPRVLFDEDFFMSGSFYDVSLDSKHFYFIKTGGRAGGPTSINVVLNWTSDFNQREKQSDNSGQQ